MAIYKDDTRESMARDMAVFSRGLDFLDAFPGCGLTENGVNDILKKCRIEDCEERATQLRKLKDSTVEIITRCLHVGPRVFNGFRGVNRLLDGEADKNGVPKPNRRTLAMVGDYMYVRRSPSGGLDYGGLRLFNHSSFPRFLHFFEFDALADWRTDEPNFFGRGNLSGTGSKCLPIYRRLDAPAYDGSGFFLVQGANLTIISFDANSARASFGAAANASELRKKRVEMHVAGRASNRAQFASRAVLFHHTHSWFGSRIDESDICSELGEDRLSAEIADRNGQAYSIL